MLLERLFFTGNQKFFIVFDALAVQIKKMSGLLHTTIVDGDSHIWLHVKEMQELERLTVEQTHALFTELGRNLITPFDREDIHFLATDLNGIARCVLHVTKQIKNYGIDCADEITEAVVKQNDQAIHMLAQILNKLKDIRELARLSAFCSDIRQIATECNDLLDNAISALLANEKDEIQLIKMMDHYQALKKLSGRIGDIANVCESIIIKYS